MFRDNIKANNDESNYVFDQKLHGMCYNWLSLYDGIAKGHSSRHQGQSQSYKFVVLSASII